ncbi:MAG: NADP-dependent oxidoreductase [Pseudomonadales bacterium]
MSNEAQNQQLYLKRHPEGIAGPDDFEVRTTPMPVIKDGQVLIQAQYQSLDAALRLIMRDSDEFLFRVRPGDLVHGSSAGQVIESKHPDYHVGDFVNGSLGVQSYAVSDGSNLERCDINQAPLPAWLGGFGVSGLTAYFAMTDVCKPQPGDTVLINGAAGAVGTMAGQFARLAGARTIGITSSRAKCDWLTRSIGYDVAINYNDPDWYAQLEQAAPDRLDVIFDNVGGSILDESLRLIGMRGTVLLCGSTSQYSQTDMLGPRNYIWLGTMRARLQGFVVFDYADRYNEARARISHWIKSKQLTLSEHVRRGTIADYPAAFQALYEGENKGKMILALDT